MIGTLRAAWLLASLAVIGCGPTLGVRAGLAARSREVRPCAERLSVLQLAENAFEVAGCGVLVEYTDVAEGRRRSFQPMVPAAALARSDLRCEYDGLAIVGDRDPIRRTFDGCGASATYVLGCQPVGGCRWAIEGEVHITNAELAAPASSDGWVPPPPPGSGPPPPAEVPPPPGAP